MFDYAPIILREMKFSKGWGVEMVGARREGERGGGLASAAIRLCFPNETERPWKRIFAWSWS